MSGESSAKSVADFFAMAQREGLLAAEVADRLIQESVDQQLSPAQFAMQRGYLSAMQVEVVETLLNPRNAVAGYEIQGLLGLGGMGIVYRARQNSLGRIVALKTVLLSGRTSSNRLSRFEQEAQTVGKLLHPHIVTAYDFGRDGNRVYFAMELVEGRDAEQWIEREGPLTETATWGLIRQAASGLAQAAELGVVHRDIKPANLLLLTPPKGFPLPPGLPLVKIADFGLALMTSEVDDRTRLTSDNMTVGSPHYMAPEQLAQEEIDHRADIYALGATAYHMLAGHPPFDGLTLPQIYAQKLNNDPPSLASLRAGLSAETISLVENLMHRDLSQRTADYAAVLEQIDRLRPDGDAPSSAWSLPARTVSTDTRPYLGKTLANQAPPTTDSPLPVPASRSPRWFETFWRAAVIVGMLAGVFYAVSLWRHRGGDIHAELTPTGYQADLFNGVSLDGWRVMKGACSPAEDDEGGAVIAANDCLVSVPLFRKLPDQRQEPLQHYRLMLNVELRDAEAVELQFGLQGQSPAGPPRLVLRIERERIVFGRQMSDAGELKPLVPPVNRTIAPAIYHELKIERQQAEWRVFVDDQFIGRTPTASDEQPLFRLAVASAAEKQPAWIADVAVEELAAP